MPTSINIRTGTGVQQVSVPNAGTDDYYQSLAEIAEMLNTACRDSFIPPNSICIGDPKSPSSGLPLAAGAVFKKDIPFDPIIKCGAPICIPMLMVCFYDGRENPTFDWQPPALLHDSIMFNGVAGLWQPDSWQTKTGIAVCIEITGGNNPYIKIANPDHHSNGPILLRGTIWFPNRRETTAKFVVT